MPDSPPAPYSAWIVMGVSGSGKSTVAEALANAMQVAYADADDFHPPENVAKMRSGVPLEDVDRWPWLDTLSRWLVEESPCVLACSAHKQSHRTRLAQHGAAIRFVYLHTDIQTLRQRMESREHFMPVSLLQTQFDAMEPPSEDDALILDGTLPVDQLVAAIVSDARR
ncbi:gluconokinase [Algisphaera agarilytica]|uniref:Gluconokinase n=1 Tax=Algisphaera agarilytica TaxID=1385975 RepID=A0A7X0H798_9BACT|nr:gluconokinase [Algisphaera agarilytica]MBB6430595.1 gluconokinase [Algisphaera agarilytica]